MKVCLFGAGAVGGHLGALLHRAGVDVILVARGENLAAIRRDGLKLLIEGQTFIEKVRCTDDTTECGPQDYVIICLKAHSISSAVDSIRPLLGDNTTVVTAANGLPYWYFYRHGGEFENRILQTVDPGGRQWAGLGPGRAIGCIVNPATELVAPGVVKHVYGDKFPLGEPDGSASVRVTRFSEAMQAAGLQAPVRSNIRNEIWLKLWGNLCLNPISVLTQATLDVIAADPEVRGLARQMMAEAEIIGERLGVKFRVSIERRLDGAQAVGSHRTSMLQDLDRGRPMEIDPIIGVIQELGRLLNVATPTVDSVLALVRMRAEVADLYKRATSTTALLSV